METDFKRCEKSPLREKKVLRERPLKVPEMFRSVKAFTEFSFFFLPCFVLSSGVLYVGCKKRM